MRILVVDDHALFREGLRLLLAKQEPDGECLEAGSGEEALALVQSCGVPELALVDLNLPGMSGYDCLVALRAAYPDLPVVMLSSEDELSTVIKALDLGAMGFIPKSSHFEELCAALNLVLAKGIYLPPSVFLAKANRSGAPATATALPASVTVAAAAGGTRPSSLGLSARQAEVLYLILQGKSAKVIARDLDLSPATIKTHTSAVLRALNVTNRTQAVIAAGQLRLRFD